MSTFTNRFIPNSIILKALRSRVHGSREFLFLTIYLVGLSAVIAFFYITHLGDSQTFPTADAKNDLGKTLFFLIFGIQTMLVCVFAPTAFTKTLTLIVASMPIQSLAFLFGGVAWLEIGVSQLMLVVSAVFYRAIGRYFSNRLHSTQTAQLATYSTIFMLAIGLPFFLFILIEQLYFVDLARIETLQNLSPADVKAFVVGLPMFAPSFPLSAALSYKLFALDGSMGWFTAVDRSGASNFLVLSPYWLNMLFSLFCSLILYRSTVSRLQTTALVSDYDYSD